MKTTRRKRTVRTSLAAVVGLGTSLTSGCASSAGGAAPGSEGGAGARTSAAVSDEHLAALETVPMAAVRLVEGPSLALEHWQYLSLSVDQLRRLEDLDLRVGREREVLLLEMEAARKDLSAATDGPLDEVRVRAALDRMGDARTEASLLSLRARDQTLALLTAEQAMLLNGFAREHVHMMMMGWVTEICTGASGTDALVSDATGAMTPCIAMPGRAESVDREPLLPHVHD